jgi:hypothetical protein
MSITLPVYTAFQDRDLRSHLGLLHGLYTGDIPDPGGLLAAHDADHAAPFGHRRIAHTHTPDPGEDLAIEEWIW